MGCTRVLIFDIVPYSLIRYLGRNFLLRSGYVFQAFNQREELPLSRTQVKSKIGYRLYFLD